MSPEAQRIAIAEACGLISRSAVEEYEKHKKPDSMSVFQYYDIPNYLSDLNAMRDAESRLSDGEKWTQIKHIVKWVGAPDAFPLLARSESIRLLEANAAQRAEAFLRTLGLWLDGPPTP